MASWIKVGALARVVNVSQECNRHMIGATGRIAGFDRLRHVATGEVLDCPVLDSIPGAGFHPDHLEPAQPDGASPSKWEYCAPEIQELMEKAKEAETIKA